MNMRKVLVIAGMILQALSASAQGQVIKIQELTCSNELGQNRAARAQEATEENVVSTQTPNGTLWLTYDKDRNEVTLEYLTRDSVVSKTYTAKVPRNKDLYGDLYLPGIIQNGVAKGAKLVRIKDNAFQGCNNLTAIIVPSTVEELGGGALRANSRMKAIMIPSTVKKVGRNHTGLQVSAYMGNAQTLVVNSQAALTDSVIYYGCGIKTLIIGDSVSVINEMNFKQIDSLSSVTIGRNVREIGHQAFMGCKSLRSIHLPASVKKIDPMAFHYGSGYTSSFTPTPLERIEVEDYDTYKLLVDSGVNLQSYTRIYLAGNDITGTYTPKQEGGTNQTAHVLPEGATEIPNNFFYGDTTLVTYEIPNTVTRIESYAFNNCRNLESVVIPNSVTWIGYGAFRSCSKLKSITIPESVTYVAQNAFQFCNSELQVTFLSDKAGMTWENHMLLSSDKTILYDATNFFGSIFNIPETVTDVRSLPYGINELHISAKVTKFSPEYIYSYSIKNITVDKDNKAFIVSDNVLYSKDMKTLVAIPQSVKGKYIVPESVDSICPFAVRANETDTYYNFNLDIFQLNRVLPTVMNLQIEYSDKIIYLLPIEYNSQYSNLWGKNVFDVATYVEPEVSPIKIGKKTADYYSVKVKVDEWPEESQPIHLVMNGISYPFNPVDSTFFVDRLDTICNYLNKIEGRYDYSRYIPFTVHPKKGSDILPARDSIYYKNSKSSFSIQGSSTYTTYDGEFFLYDDHPVNSDDFYVECTIGPYVNYSQKVVEKRSFNFSRADFKPLSNMSSRKGYPFHLDGLKPGYRINYMFYAYYNGEKREISYSKEVNIPNFIMEADHLSCGTTTLSGRITCDAKDLGIIMKGVNGKTANEFFSVTGQTPGKVTALDIFVTALIAGKDTTFHKTIYLPMAQLELTTLQPTDINKNSARLLAATNIDDREAAIGFEWRRYDAPEGMMSYSIDGAIYQGQLMATLTGLDQNTYYRFRPYLKTADETYYGEWYIFGTNSNAGVTAPVVHTTDAVMDANDAFTYLFTGYVLPGNEDITEQGFEYWQVGNVSSRQRVRASVENINSIQATGMHMTATAKGLTPQTNYAVRSYAKTASQTVYGETITLKTTTLSGIFAPKADGTAPDVYSTTGVLVRRQATSLNGLPKGLYIVNGTKVFVK